MHMYMYMYVYVLLYKRKSHVSATSRLTAGKSNCACSLCRFRSRSQRKRHERRQLIPHPRTLPLPRVTGARFTVCEAGETLQIPISTEVLGVYPAHEQAV